MGFQAELVLLLMFASTVKTQEEKVKFWRNTVTLNCPGNGTWFECQNNGKDIYNGTTFELKYKKEFNYYCEYVPEGETSKKKYHFYVKGKACDNCFELDAVFFMIAIIVDVAGTAGLMMMIFRCTKKRSSDGPAHSPRPPVPSGGRPPAVPAPDYEQLNPRTRAADTYSTVVNRMG